MAVGKDRKLLLGSEKSVLAYLVENPSMIFDIHKVRLDETDFSSDLLRHIYLAVWKIATKAESKDDDKDPVDPLVIQDTIATMFPSLYAESSDSYQKAIRSICSFVPSNFDDHVRIITTESCKRKSARHLEKLQNSLGGFKTREEIIQMLESSTAEFTSSLFHSGGPVSLGKRHREWVRNKVNEAREGRIRNGFSSGFDRYDEAIGGYLERGCVNVIASRMKNGKSFIALNVALYVASQGIPVLYLDAELTEDIQMGRMTSIESKVFLTDIRNGQFALNKAQSWKVKDILDDVAELNLDYEVIGGFNIEAQVSTIRRWFSRSVGNDEDGRLNDGLVIQFYRGTLV